MTDTPKLFTILWGVGLHLECAVKSRKGMRNVATSRVSLGIIIALFSLVGHVY
ncbi:hypothetical protein [Undibacterium fentianense]|uniref:Uncharacterized protein n=1 Tax=Undibacterium fentianense TaxID=2828728 RepID=A0A941E696_9BURK|nr:hypothetical protein [Undibacterium fentianense]MBR7801746.1 hypothetical protein [Undibacterium fentianense]